MVTLKDIARECNVSFSTVSKALKDSPEISGETIKLIKSKAEKMGYQPNIAARTLRTNRTYDIGIIFEDKTGAGFQHQYFATIISGLQKIAQQHGYEVTFTNTSPEKSYDYYNHIKSRNFDGVAILSADFKSNAIKKLVKSDIPTVTLDYYYDKNHTTVMSNNESGEKELVEYVVKNGHKKIAMIHGEDTLVTAERKKSFIESCRKFGIEVPQEYFAEALYNDPFTSAEATNVLLSLPTPPTCIFYPDDYSALGGIRELNSRGLVPGKDISIVGYDGIMLTSMMIPPLTTYEQDGKKIGEEIAEKLISLIENDKNFKHSHNLISGRLLKGGTVAKIN